MVMLLCRMLQQKGTEIHALFNIQRYCILIIINDLGCHILTENEPKNSPALMLFTNLIRFIFVLIGLCPVLMHFQRADSPSLLADERVFPLTNLVLWGDFSWTIYA